MGTRPEDINITGGDFIDTQNSHAPEEVIPGIVFDTLDMEVYTDPSDDFTFDGNGFPIFYTARAGDGETSEFTYASTSMNSDVDNIFVYLDDVVQRDVTINYVDRTIHRQHGVKQYTFMLMEIQARISHTKKHLLVTEVLMCLH